MARAPPGFGAELPGLPGRAGGRQRPGAGGRGQESRVPLSFPSGGAPTMARGPGDFGRETPGPSCVLRVTDAVASPQAWPWGQALSTMATALRPPVQATWSHEGIRCHGGKGQGARGSSEGLRLTGGCKGEAGRREAQPGSVGKTPSQRNRKKATDLITTLMCHGHRNTKGDRDAEGRKP